jgi:hypothetical protein
MEPNKPSFEHCNGHVECLMFGMRQCGKENGLPACVFVDGGKELWVCGSQHIDGDLPSIEEADGRKYWSVCNLPHREGDFLRGSRFVFEKRVEILKNKKVIKIAFLLSGGNVYSRRPQCFSV